MYEVAIAGTGSFLPRTGITNTDFFDNVKNVDIARIRGFCEKRNIPCASKSDAELFDLWVQRVTGIVSRRHISAADALPEGSEVETMACEASRAAIADAGIAADTIDHVVVATFTARTIIPNPACKLTNMLGIPHAGGVTINTACSGFLDALIDGYAKIRAGICKTVLVTSAEHMSRTIDYNDPTTAILFGDGAGACVLTRSDTKDRIDGVFTQARYSAEHITMQAGGCVVMGGGPLVQRNAVNAMFDAATAAGAQASRTLADYDYIIPHQANGRIMSELAKKMEIPETKMPACIHTCGNMSCASIPVTLDLLRKGRLPDYTYSRGSKLMLTSVAGGYTIAGVSCTL
ncbi:MAG: hypothetical protein HZC28_01295 [Spirochaetes bacterium]|nr:hypothetical protein [Spirochaetota bacterium]